MCLLGKGRAVMIYAVVFVDVQPRYYTLDIFDSHSDDRESLRIHYKYVRITKQ